MPGAAYGPAAKPQRRLRRPIVLAAVAVLIVVLIVAGILLFSAGNGSAAALATPAGLRATPGVDAVDLRWDPVPSAQAYSVLSDGRVLADKVSATSYRVELGRDSAPHQYAVAAVAGKDRSSPVSSSVSSAASGPWGTAAALQTAFPRIVPAAPKERGADGQTCGAIAAQRDTHAIDIIGCDYSNGVYLEVLRYPSNVARTDRENEVRDLADTPTTWTRSEGKPGGELYLGTDQGAPWRWWSFRDKPSYAMYASWPKHSAADLKQWWTDAPF